MPKIIVASLLCFFVILAGYAMIFKPRNDKFDESAGQVLGQFNTGMLQLADVIVQRLLAAPVTVACFVRYKSRISKMTILCLQTIITY